jgi:hypothetical protein
VNNVSRIPTTTSESLNKSHKINQPNVPPPSTSYNTTSPRKPRIAQTIAASTPHTQPTRHNITRTGGREIANRPTTMTLGRQPVQVNIPPQSKHEQVHW